MEKTKPTLQDCLRIIIEINEGVENTEEGLLQKARLLYMLQRLSFWEDIPILLAIIKHEVDRIKK